MFNARTSFTTLFCASMLLSLGCGGTEYGEIHPENSNLKPLMIVYGRFIPQHRGRPPKSIEELKKFANKSVDQEFLTSWDLAAADDMFISKRDNKPFVIAFKGEESGRPPGPADEPVIAYEQEGADGNRFVASSIGAVEQVDEETFREWVPDAQ